ncbi:tyrosine-type recombinase/integrase [Frankia sp. Cj5]|uniref:tyrosine-type recombinase/integrase n=1 Tax=Frankia sp. Cj5 TaxID=2880978 RepID=UPI001EF4553F|nr:tyrosine-type recombinase/integrase [Frankia sp. Cj5]
MTGHLELDYPWLLAHSFRDLAEANGRILGFGPGWISELSHEAKRIGYGLPGAHNSMLKACLWVALRKADPDWKNITAADLRQLRDEIIAFRDRPDVTCLRPGFAAGTEVKTWYRSTRTHVYVTHVVLHSLGVVPEQAKIISLGESPHTLPKASAEMEQLFDRYLIRAAPNRTRNRNNIRGRLRTFTQWLSNNYPEITSFTQLTRPHVEEFLTWLSTDYRHYRTGAPVSLETQRQTISVLNVFFRNTLAWGWDGVPGRPLLSHLDMPKKVVSVPRYLPNDQLAQIVTGIHTLADPYQKAANLVARWAGPRRSEIRRLELDCLDAYPDGHPRLRIPAGKTYTERIVPLHPEAADALRACITATATGHHRPLADEVTGKPTRYVFQTRGRLMSSYWLFDVALQRACEHAGLIDENGARIVTSHRFRHTVGTQLAEEGARLQTIMAILGHRSSTMSLIYSQITDPTVLKDYKNALHPGARIAGPAADAIRHHQLPQDAINWLTTNYYKTALELGHCLRLPEEGPCECDLFLTCSKFLTTTEYSPRLRDRLCLEQKLVQDATDRGWLREAERHTAMARRISELLDQLDSPE